MAIAPGDQSQRLPPSGADALGLEHHDEDRSGSDPSGRAGTVRSRAARRRGIRRSLLLVVLLALVPMLMLVHSLAKSPYLDTAWRSDHGVLELTSSPLAPLKSPQGKYLTHLSGVDGQTLPATDSLLMRSPRWAVDDAQRQRMKDAHRRLSTMLQQGPVNLHFKDLQTVRLDPAPRGLMGLGVVFWLACMLALALVGVAAAVLLAHPRGRNLPYAVIALSQAANLVVVGVETLPGLGMPTGLIAHGLNARMAFDLISAAALVHLSVLQPLRLPRGPWIAVAVWLAVGTLLATAALQVLPDTWAWTQAGMLGCGVLTIRLMSWSYRIEPNPFALLMRRLAMAATVTLLLLSLAILVGSRQGAVDRGDIALSAVVWYFFLATLTLLLPVFSRAQPMMRELAMLAGTCTVATSLDLLLVAGFALSPLASLPLSVFLALAVHTGSRRWLLNPMSGQHVPGAERMFEKLYRLLREVEANPRNGPDMLASLLRNLFDPLQVHTLDRSAARSRVLGSGSALLVPVPAMDAGQGDRAEGSILLRFAARGKRMFSRDDARLTDRMVDQLRRAVAYDKAVERGRSEERARIAQDLHDDIGARLLTLMYKAQSPEMEDYLRHTLKDLKTLTRGLAANDQRLSHATAEWKTDIGQRLSAAQIELSWSFVFDRDIVLSVVQWSALTRVLRELVSNAIQHSCATHVDIAATLEAGRLRLTLADDGIGRNPRAWSHGLGLGGVRKRVKLLGGDVQWAENGAAGVICTVLIAELDARH